MSRSVWLLLALLTGCASRASRPMVVLTGTGGEDAQIRDVIRRALVADAAGLSGDQFYEPGATVLANGRARLSPPRFAGVSRGGTVTVFTLEVEGTMPYAWGFTGYGWAAKDGTAMESGRATVILRRGADGWRIIHVHSSMALPWERDQ